MKRRDTPTVSDVMQVARDLGYRSRSEAIKVLKTNGIEGKFDPERFSEYVAILTTHAKTLDSILNKLNKDKEVRAAGAEAEDLPARATRLMKSMGQRPWLMKPVAKDAKGKYRKMESRDDLKEGETMVYEGVTKEEHLKEIDDAMDRGKPKDTGI